MTFFLSIMAPGVCFASEVLSLSGSPVHALGDRGLAYLRDRSGTLSFEDALRAVGNGEFEALRTNPAFGYTSDVIWLTLTVRREPSDPDAWVLVLEPPTIDHVSLWQINPDGVRMQVGGDQLPAPDRALFYRSPAFRIELTDDPVTLVLRVQSRGQMNMVPRLYSASHFQRWTTMENMVIGGYFGVFLVNIVLGLALAASFRANIFLVYSGVVLVLALFELGFSGLVGLFVLPDAPGWANRIYASFLGLAGFSANIFYAHILGVDATFKLSRLLLFGCYVIAIASSVLALLGLAPWFQVVMLASLVAAGVVLSGHSVRQLRHGENERRFIGMVYIVYFVMIFITLASNLGFTGVTITSLYLAQFAQLLHAIALSAALFHFVSVNRRQVAQASQALLRNEQEIEREQGFRREQQRLLEMIAHEVRTPVAVVSSAAESLVMLDRPDQDSEKRASRYRRINSAVKRIESLMAMIDVGRDTIGAADNPTQQVAVSLSVLISNSLDMLDPDRRRCVLLVATGFEPVVRSRLGAVGTVIQILIDNAIKYASPDSPVDIALDRADHGHLSGVALRICNRSDHLPAGIEERMFEKFVRGDESPGVPGLGLGLYLARAVAEQHGGNLSASVIDERVSVTLWLPLSSEVPA